MRTIGVVTVARSDYGIYLPLLRKITATEGLELLLFVSGMHLSPEFGQTEQVIESDGFAIHERIEMLLSGDSPQSISKSMGLGTIGFAQAFSRRRPDILVLLGDRFEMHAAAVAAIPFNIPMAHIHGGESTEGLIDEAIRHSLTKISHLHFASTELYGKRIVQMGEEPWRVTVTGAPSLDNLRSTNSLSRVELEKRFGLRLQRPFLLVTYHPVTLAHDETSQRISDLLWAIEASGFDAVFTFPNADTSGRVILEKIREYVRSHPQSQVTANLGVEGYFGLMRLAAAMVGNSSSGIIEAASFKLPVVNIGMRQQGRLRARNVIDAGDDKDEILAAIRRATAADFVAGLADLQNPYGDGYAADRMVERLRDVELGTRLLVKRFWDLGV